MAAGMDGTNSLSWPGDGLVVPVQGGDIETPKSLCGVCAVRTECLAYALEDPGLRGIWGATSDRERMRLRRATG